MATARQGRRIYFLPFFPLDNELQVGDVLFWPFYQLKERFIPDELVRRDLERIFGCYVDDRGAILNTITVASVRAQELSPLSTDDERYLDAVVKAVAFASIVKNIYGFQYRNSENFQVFTQELVANQEEITLTYRFRRKAFGGYIRPQGPYPLTQIRFTQPQNILLSGTRELDQRLLDACGSVIDARNGNQNAERMIRSLEWFYFSHFDLRDIPDTAIAVMMATAFESLLELSFPGTRQDLIRKVERFLLEKAKGFLERSAFQRIRKTGTSQSHTEVGWWAHTFYGVRSSIVHGDNCSLIYNNKSHIEIADLIFIECFKRMLEGNGFYSYSAEDEQFRKEMYERLNF